ncbi:MAG: nucleoside 2-deoxyribosyltransferase, partial [Erysipelotrichaceae bacterium]|nr:nucleoside 2-deoxyribosyltransferase [Erysipelotrichaceae bacterium]
MKNKPIIYLAGYECFLPNGKEIALETVNYAKELGFDAFSPILSDIDLSTNKKESAKQIFFNNLEHIHNCDIFVANLNN